ncbi:MAG: AAA family ATPase [Flavobacteriales bacterium]|nr:AAA family ATPase [Flavobacteriales bacterium]
MARITSIKLQGYRPFRDFNASFLPLEVMVGANGSGKSSLFEFLKFLRDSCVTDIPPEIVAGTIGQNIFHIPGPERLWWSVEVDTGMPTTLRYQGELLGPKGNTSVISERVESSRPLPGFDRPLLLLNIRNQTGKFYNPETRRLEEQDIVLGKPNQLALSTVNNARFRALYELKEYIAGWRFYSSFNIDNSAIRKSVLTSQEPQLAENASNLSAVLNYFQSEHGAAFQAMQHHMRQIIPGFRKLSVPARGGPGEVIAFWEEHGVDKQLSIADLSDGIIRLICWIALCLHPDPPGLVCIDEPDQGVHPRTLPILASLFEQLSQRTQVLLATHSSYFLSRFSLENIAVFKKTDGESRFLKPNSSQVLLDSLRDFGTEEIERLHPSNELEHFSSEQS